VSCEKEDKQFSQKSTQSNQSLKPMVRNHDNPSILIHQGSDRISEITPVTQINGPKKAAFLKNAALVFLVIWFDLLSNN